MELIEAAAEVVLHFWPLTLVPALLLLAARPLARMLAFAGGLLFFVATLFLSPATGPDNPLLIIPFFGLPLSVAAMLAEGALRVARLVRRRRPRAGRAVDG